MECIPSCSKSLRTNSIGGRREAGSVKIRILTVEGRLVREMECDGEKKVIWDLSDEKGRRVPSGKIDSVNGLLGEYAMQRKVILVE